MDPSSAYGVAMSLGAAWGVLDGLFQQALLGHVSGDATALPTLVAQVHDLMPLVLANSVDPVR